MFLTLGTCQARKQRACCNCECVAVAVVPRQICHHCHFILDLVTQVALQGSGIGSMGRAGWVVGAAISKILSTWAMGAGREN